MAPATGAPLLARTTEGTPAAQVLHEIALERAARLDKQVPVDRFVRHPHSLIVGIAVDCRHRARSV